MFIGVETEITSYMWKQTLRVYEVEHMRDNNSFRSSMALRYMLD